MKTARTRTTWPDGTTTVTWWAEAKPDGWLETAVQVTTPEDEEEVRSRARGTVGEHGVVSIPIVATKRYLQMRPDSVEFFD